MSLTRGDHPPHKKNELLNCGFNSQVNIFADGLILENDVYVYMNSQIYIEYPFIMK